MIPSALSGQLQQGLADFLRFSFWSSTPGMEHVINDLIDEPGGLLKGPYISLKLPFTAGKNPSFFGNVPMGFTPHLHQEQAFTRLSGRRKLSTLIATGTGSGKTESFLLPILDHCLNESDRKGVKAILVYPMNALATDQAGRIARMIHSNDKLRGTVRAGLYVGEDAGKGAKTETQMGPNTVITDRAVMKDAPPDILLTNYKMLDYLLLRPSDQRVWQHNGPGALSYLVVDEIHTFDGAQGTDLACLVRRLKRRLQVDDGSLCCVGTSATLGGEKSGQTLIDYAQEVFGEPFDSRAVISESRIGERAYLSDCGRDWTDEPTTDDRATMDPAHWTDPEAWVRAQTALWFGEVHAGIGDTWAVELGERLKHHAAFQSLLVALGGDTVDLERLVAHMARQRTAWRDEPTLGRLALTSMIGLVSAARAWRPELPEVAAAREATGEPRPVQPFLEVRVQLWQRELRRMVASLSPRPRLRHSMDLDKDTRRKHLPLIHCRECGAMGWATVVQRDKPHLMGTPLDRFYRAFFSADPQVEFLFPADAAPKNDPSWARPPFEIDLESMTKVDSDDALDGPVLAVVPSHSVKATKDGPELSRDCPFCAARASLTLIGFRAATLTSVYIDQLFASPFNDDKKLLAFSDSVQDAAHRAGFFGARTWRTTLRIAMLQVLSGEEGLTLAGLAKTLGPTWRRRLGTTAWVSMFLASNMTWLHDWGHLKRDGELPEDSNLDRLVERRLQFEVFTEFGMQAGIGRSLPRTGTAGVGLDPARLATAVSTLLEPLQNEVPGLRDLSAEALEAFIVGFLYHLRTRGGILDGALPEEYVTSGGRDVHSFKRDYALPAFSRSSRLPALLTDRPRSHFETWGGSSDTNWYTRWVPRCLGQGAALTADAGSTYPVLLPGLVAAGLLKQRIGKKQEAIWGLDPDALIVSRAVARVACQTCGQAHHAAEAERSLWSGVPCLTARCPGHYEAADVSRRDYFSSLYGGGDLQRIFTEEHTGLLTRAERETVEREFKAYSGAADDPAARKPWYPNLLSCTPTLEMGIDIGDLSTTILCSVPPTQANYLQRIGRAGRRDGNAFVLTVAGGRPHDLYFYADPAEMFAGEVSPPGIFLDAPAVLERQLTAFCFDRWVATGGAEVDLPHQMRPVFRHLSDTGHGHFPFNFLSFVKGEEPALLREFGEMFSETISDDTVQHLRRYMLGTDEGNAGLRWNILEALQRERMQRDSLSSKAQALRQEIRRLQKAEAKSADHKEVIEQLDREKDALLALVAAINRRRTLEFLTEEGLLPNYAFPEAAVSLKSVIWRKKKVAPAAGSNYETWTHEYKRSPASALSELAPHADFYAGGRRVRIDQVDVAVSKPEDWRFCAECNHAQRIDTGDEAKACPACDSVDWSDDGQRFRLMKLQQVFANAPDRDSRIRDDRDERQPRFFQRQVMVDIRDEDRAGAWHVDDDRLPFGFEYLKRATFREINFGEPSDQGAASTIAGREAVRPGFQLCAKCGMVQTPNKDPAHALSCPSRKKGAKQNAKQEIEECLYLYREFQSEALRLLLPMLDVGTERELHSFVAALQVGLKAHFKGSVDHLRTTLYSDPVEGTALRKQYLVLFDSVPGGTGYLKQLVTRQGEAGRMPMYEILDLARAGVEDCACWSDPERDGCYSCLYAYRNAKDMDDTSAQTASDLLRRLLAGEDKLVEIGSLGDVSITQLMDSMLELRFLEALRLVKSPSGKQASLRPSVLQTKPGYRWSLGAVEWVVEPQVNPPPSESCGVPVSIDFVMRPATARSDRKLAIFLDGWAYHKDRVGQDLRQRMALLASGNWDVWTFTWADIDQKLGVESAECPIELAIPDHGKLKAMLQRVAKTHAGIASGSVFDWFEAELLDDGIAWGEVANCVLAARMAPALVSDVDAWRAFVDEVAPSAARDSLRAMTPRLTAADLGEVNPHFELIAIHDGDGPALVCTLDDSETLYEAPEYKDAWRGYLRLFQLLRHTPNAWFMTRSSSDEGAMFQGIAVSRGAHDDSDAAWVGFEDIEPEFRAFATVVMEANVPEPEVGMDIPDTRGDTWAEAELLWDGDRVALTSRSAVALALGQPAADWQVFYLEDLADDPAPLLDALQRTEAN